LDLPIVKGTLDLLVLKALEREPLHGFEITTWIETNSREKLGFDDSAIYHALYRMEKRGWVESSWGVTENNRKARYYQVTSEGQRHLKLETKRLLRYAEAISAILTEPA
jgi:PadR family transcriptional regulator PadR